MPNIWRGRETKKKAFCLRATGDTDTKSHSTDDDNCMKPPYCKNHSGTYHMHWCQHLTIIRVGSCFYQKQNENLHVTVTEAVNANYVQEGRFKWTWQYTKQSKIPVLTHIHSILYPLHDVKGIVHVTFQDVKLDIITAQVIGAISRHGGSQENNLCWKITIRWGGEKKLLKNNNCSGIKLPILN